MKAFDLAATWPRVTRQEDPVAATFALLRIDVGGETATTHVDLDDGSEAVEVEQPMLYIAEWLVDNWWSLLWEPEKNDELSRKAADRAFVARHSLQAAGHGFALPDIRVLPVGSDIRFAAHPYVAQHARVRFLKNCDGFVSRSGAEAIFADFINSVCSRVSESHPLVTEWSLIKNTTEEAAQFCRLKGALGLSPYVTHTKIENTIDKAAETLSGEQLLDLCQTATIDDFYRSANVASLVSGILENGGLEIDISPLSRIGLPSDNPTARAFKRGYAAAKALREGLGIAENDISGGSSVFDILHLDWRSGDRIDLKGFPTPIAGAVDRSQSTGRLALVHEAPSSRRFAAARAAYFLWSEAGNGRRLLTSAVTREQQASRAFAAELLVPHTLVRARASDSRISNDQLHAIAEEAMVAPEVVRRQAVNGHLMIAG